MDYRKFSFTNENYLILKTATTYTRTESKKGWKANPENIEQEIVSPSHYTNYVTAIPFFNNFGFGAYCRAKYTYNAPGYLPTIITTVSPGQDTKIITTFEFVEIDKLKINAGWRENEIIKTAKRFAIEFADGARMIYFYTDSNGDTAQGIFDTKRNQWRG